MANEMKTIKNILAGVALICDIIILVSIIGLFLKGDTDE